MESSFILGPTSQPLSVVSEFEHNKKHYAAGDAFAADLVSQEKLASLLTMGFLRPTSIPSDIDPLIRVTTSALLKSRDNAFELHGEGHAARSTLFDSCEQVPRVCFMEGFIGVSPPTLETMARVAMHAEGSEPVLIQGDRGTEQEAVARSLHALGGHHEDARFESVSCCDATLASEILDHIERWPTATLFLRDIDEVDAETEVRIRRHIDDGGLRVIGATHCSFDEIERTDKGRDLFRCMRKRTIQLPPLYMRPGDLPLLLFYFIKRYNRGDYGTRSPLAGYKPGGQRQSNTRHYVGYPHVEWPSFQEWAVDAVSLMSLYFAVCRPWAGNIEELERAVVEACDRGCANQAGHMPWVFEMDGLDGADHASEPSFGPDFDAFTSASIGDPELRVISGGDLVPLKTEELVQFDIKEMMEEIDKVAETQGRRRWTLDHRLEYMVRGREIKSQTLGEPPGTDEGSGEQREEKGRYVFRLTGHYWDVAFGDHGLSPLNDSKGMRCIAYLLAHPNQHVDVGMVRAEVDGKPALDQAAKEAVLALVLTGELSTDDNRVKDLFDDEVSLARLGSSRHTIEKRIAVTEGDEKFELEDQVKYIDEILSKAQGLGGRPRPIDRSENERKSMSAAYQKAVKVLEEAGYSALVRHLKIAMKVGRTCSYTPEKPPSWEL
jgi:hypothetical protein